MLNTDNAKKAVINLLTRIRNQTKTTIELNDFEKLILDEERKPLNDEINNRFILKNGELLYSGGDLDYLDPYINELSILQKIDVVVLKEQTGNSNRLVSECLDNRPRNESFLNLYYLN